MPSLSLGRYDPRRAGVRVEADRLVQDSREVQPGDAFVSFSEAHAADALARGASAVIGVGGHEIEGLGAALLGSIADDFYGHPSRDLSLVGVTGTNGKTSVVQLLAQAWHELGLTGASIGTIGAGVTGALQPTGLTTPPVVRVHELLASFRDAGVRNCAVEVSSHALQQGRVDAAVFDVVAFTNLTRDHLDYHGDMESYAAAKARIFDLPGSPRAVINLDDERGPGFLQHVGARGIGVSSHGHPDAVVTAADVRSEPDGVRFTLGLAGASVEVASPLLGRFNVDNLLIAVGVLHAQGVEVARIADVLGALQPPFGRMNRLHPSPDAPLVVIDYAHTPDALGQSLAALVAVEHERIVTVFGATGDRDRGKRPDMARVVEAASDLVIVTDDDVHHEDGDAIVADLLAGFADPDAVVVCRDRGAAIERAITAAGARDIVLVAGKGHEAHLVVGDALVPFSDTEVATRVLRERFG